MNYDDILNQFNPTELLEFKKYVLDNLKALLSKKDGVSNILKKENVILYCPNCNTKLYRNGKTKTGVQKYICKDCKTTISETTGTVLYHSKKTFDIWKEVIDNLFDGLTLRRMSEKLKINLHTSFDMRHKVLKALSKFVEELNLKGEIETDEKYVSINLKGTKKDKMPRLSKKRTSSAFRGISHHKVCIATAIDEYDNLIMKVTGLGPITTDMLEVTYKDRIEKQSKLITDCKSSYIRFCENFNLKLTSIKSGTYQNDELKNLSNINNVHSQLEVWLCKFRGVSTRHIQDYLNWFTYMLVMKRKYETDKLETKLYKDVIVNNNYISSKDILSIAFPINLKTAYGEYRYGIFAS